MVQDKGFSVSTLDSDLLQHLLPALWSKSDYTMNRSINYCLCNTYIHPYICRERSLKHQLNQFWLSQCSVTNLHMDICFKHFLDKFTSVELHHQYVKVLVKIACSPLVIVLMDDSFLLWEEIECLGLILSHVLAFFFDHEVLFICQYPSNGRQSDSSKFTVPSLGN